MKHDPITLKLLNLAVCKTLISKKKMKKQVKNIIHMIKKKS